MYVDKMFGIRGSGVRGTFVRCMNQALCLFRIPDKLSGIRGSVVRGTFVLCMNQALCLFLIPDKLSGIRGFGVGIHVCINDRSAQY